MRITYDEGIPETLLPIIKERVESLTFAFPRWSQDLRVFYDAENPNKYVAEINSEYYYRFIQMTIFPYFFSDLHWKETLLHEIHHSLFAPYTSVVHKMVNTFIHDDTVKEYILAQLSDAEEAVVQDSAHCLKCIIDNTEKN
jgi:hypothetical protein